MTVKISRQARAGLIDGFLRAFGVQACLRRCKAVVCPRACEEYTTPARLGIPALSLVRYSIWGSARR